MENKIQIKPGSRVKLKDGDEGYNIATVISVKGNKFFYRIVNTWTSYEGKLDEIAEVLK